MRLEQITLHGFKSFAERTVLKVLPGITGIVGPNGCGKSNIAEAVRWALGEQSAKSLRGQRMEDLVFHGSASRKPIGMAEVNLTFSNDGTLAVPWTEIEVTRRLYRTGESEYLLNKTPSRLRDMLDLFAGTGANPRAYSIMDQDKLNHVLTAKPHERRVFIEEAAGIARYKQQRHETEGKLDGARQNLVRVRDVMDEVKRQLTSLERQAKRAAHYKALEAERRQLALSLVAADYAALVTEAERVAALMTVHRDREFVLRAEASQHAARAAAQRVLIQESDHRLADLRQAVQKVQGDVERLLERREQLGVQRRELVAEERRLDEDLRLTVERLDGITSQRAALAESAREAEVLVANPQPGGDPARGTSGRASGGADRRPGPPRGTASGTDPLGCRENRSHARRWRAARATGPAHLAPGAPGRRAGRGERRGCALRHAFGRVSRRIEHGPWVRSHRSGRSATALRESWRSARACSRRLSGGWQREGLPSLHGARASRRCGSWSVRAKDTAPVCVPCLGRARAARSTAPSLEGGP